MCGEAADDAAKWCFYCHSPCRRDRRRIWWPSGTASLPASLRLLDPCMAMGGQKHAARFSGGGRRLLELGGESLIMEAREARRVWRRLGITTKQKEQKQPAQQYNSSLLESRPSSVSCFRSIDHTYRQTEAVGMRSIDLEYVHNS
jgi:hypothetical protein